MIIFSSLMVVVLTAGLTLNMMISAKLSVPADGVRYTVIAGDNLHRIAADLSAKGYIKNPKLLTLYAKITGQGKKLSVGTFYLPYGTTLKELPAILSSSKTEQLAVTFPEGLWITEMAERLDAVFPGLGTEYMNETLNNIAKYQQRFPELNIPDDSMEGFCYPDTYHFPYNVDAEMVVMSQLKQFKTVCWSEWEKSPSANGLGFYDTLKLASLVEGEARLASEGADIAGVYINRLNTKGWRMECDATIIYAKGERVKRVLYADLKIDSPYNSYTNAGLPPTPINNPGAASFYAALHPNKTEYYFYFAKGDGSHVFARTFAEHNENIRKYRK